jgi:hypothetical protein
MHVFKHPKYYEEMRQRAKRYQKELRERNKSDQVISDEASTEATSVHPGPGLKQQASSSKRQATSTKPQAPSDSKTSEQDS